MSIIKRWASYLIIALAVLFSSCGDVKQESPKGDDGRKDTGDRAATCSDVSLVKNLLVHDNLDRLFTCVGWSTEYPALHSALKTIPATSWNHLMVPLDSYFFSDLAKRDQYISFVKELDAKGGLDDLAQIFASFMHTNFYDQIYTIFSQQKNRADLKNFYSLIDMPVWQIKQLTKVLRFFYLALDNSIDKNLKIPLKKLLSDDKFSSARINLLDKFWLSVGENSLTQLDRQVLPRLFSLLESEKSLPALHVWLTDEKFSSSDFTSILKFPIYNYSSFFHDLGAMWRLAMPEMECYVEGQLAVKVEREVSRYIYSLVDSSIDDFFDDALDTVAKMRLADAACGIDEISGGVSFFYIFNQFNNFLNLKNSYNLMRIINYIPLKVDTENVPELYWLEFFSGEVASAFNQVNETIFIKSGMNLWEVMFNILRDLNSDTYLSMGKILPYFLEKDNYVALVGFAHLWKLLTSDNKKFLLKIIDTHFYSNVNYLHLGKFYLHFLDDAPYFIPKLAEQLSSDDRRLDKTVEAISDVAYAFKGSVVLTDLKKFFSREGILKIIEEIIHGVPERQAVNNQLSTSLTAYDDLLKPVIIPIRLAQPSEQQLARKRELARCIGALSESGVDFYRLVELIPPDCQKIESESFTLKLLTWANLLSSDFADTFEVGPLLDDQGILNPEMFNFALEVGKIFDETLPKGIKTLWEMLREQLFLIKYRDGEGAGYIGLMEDMLKYLDDIFNLKLVDQEKLEHVILMEIAQIPPEQIIHFTNNISELLDDYATFVVEEKKYVAKYPCSTYFKHTFDYNPCPPPQVIKGGIKKILAKMAQVHKGVPTYTDLLFQVFMPGEGIAIPLNGNNKYNLSLEESIMLFFDANDKKYYQKIKFKGKHDKKKKKYMASLVERIEITIRESSFDTNKVGTVYKNSIVTTDNYKKEAKKIKNLYRVCTFFKWCGLILNKNKKRMAKNALESYDSLIALDNNYSHANYKTFRYGKWTQAYMKTFVASSHKDAQRSTFGSVFLSQKVLKKHNGMIFVELNYLSFLRNLSRFVYDRLADNNADIVKFVTDHEFQRVNKNIFKGFSLNKLTSTFNKIVEKYVAGDNKLVQEIADSIVDWIDKNSYSDLRFLEETITNLLVVMSYHDSDDKLLEILPLLIDLWPTIKANWPVEQSLVNFLRPINNLLAFFRAGLNKEKFNPKKEIYQAMLNDLFKFNEVLLLKHKDILVSGVEALLTQYREKPVKSNNLLRDFYRYLDRLHFILNDGVWEEDRTRLISLAQNMRTVVNHNHFTLLPLQKYIFTTLMPDRGHYREIPRLVNFLVTAKRDEESKKSRFWKMGVTLFDEEYTNFTKFFDETLELISFTSLKNSSSIF